MLCAGARPRASVKQVIDDGNHGGLNTRNPFLPLALLLDRLVEESPVLPQGSAERGPQPVSVHLRLHMFVGLGFKGFLRVKDPVSNENKVVAVESIAPAFSDDVDRASCGAAEFGRKAVIDHAKLAHNLR